MFHVKREVFLAIICTAREYLGLRVPLSHENLEVKPWQEDVVQPDIALGSSRSGLAKMLLAIAPGATRGIQRSIVEPRASVLRQTEVTQASTSSLAQAGHVYQAHQDAVNRSQKVGVVLLNLGGPERLQDVKPFLYNLFADPEIIRLPVPLLQKPLARLISNARAPKSMEAYASIGGGSPQRRITEKQARELQNVLRGRGLDVTTYVAMRYWHPYTEVAIADLKADGIDQVVVLPLYPHFSISTSGSSFRELERLRKQDSVFASKPIRVIRSYFDDAKYVGAMVDSIANQIQASPDSNTAHVFFSAHGVPRNYVEQAGDPYKEEIEACTKIIMERLEEKIGFANNYTLAYQSRVGPLEWLKPYTEEALRELGASGIKDLVVVPISFVNEHIETLEEIDMEYREIAMESGIRNFRRVPTLGTDRAFIDALADMVEVVLEGPEVSLEEASVLSEFPSFGPGDQLAKFVRTWLK